MSNLAPPAASPATCPSCHARSRDGVAFCQQCGERLPEHAGQVGPAPGGATAMPQSPPPAPGTRRKRLANLAAEHHGKEIRSARIAIMVVSVLTMIAAAALWALLNAEVARIRSDPGMFVVESAVREARLMIVATFALGVVFFGLFFWAKRNPFGATLTALIIYLTSIVANAAMDPTSLSKGIIFKVIIIAVLAKGVQAGLAYKRLQEAGHG